MEEFTQRQKKIGGVLQKDLADILQKAATDGGIYLWQKYTSAYFLMVKEKNLLKVFAQTHL